MFGDCFIDTAVKKRLAKPDDVNTRSIQFLRKLGWLALMEENAIFIQFYDCIYRRELWVSRNSNKVYKNE